ncbi:hypothetical protein PVK06_035175 [Gossypium arboreum]|uniref:Uncharacterized protein n=1 Tax=Gossypium arboreum TaxID=29729 RepID=A0ABR0NG43_GOSAR|nr:hypothetical protein PVK06_035175 [Gossypium arboreum]
MLVNNLSERFNKLILGARGKPILTMMETIKTKIMLLIVKKKEEAKKIKGILCPKIKKKLDLNMKDSLGFVPSHASEDRYQDLTGIPCMHAVAVIHVKDEYPETYVQTGYTKQTQLAIYSNFIRPVKRHKVGAHKQVVAQTQQQATPTQQKTATQ